MASLSEKLRRERELRGISLKQISEDTKIGVRFLEALEEDTLERIPGEFYRRSYLRAYARYLGLDEERAVNAYLYSRGEGRSEDEPARSESDSSSSPWLLWAALVVVVLVGASLLLLRSGDGGSEAAIPPAASSSPAVGVGGPDLSTDGASEGEVRVPSPEMVPPAAVVDRPANLPAADPSAPLRLVLTVTEPCWLEIQADGVVVATGLKEQGFQQALSAHDEVRLWLGNAGGISLWVNERPVKPLGRDGQVRKDLTITPKNLAEYLSDSEDFS